MKSGHGNAPRRTPGLAVAMLNGVALVALGVPTLLILRSSGIELSLGANLFTAAAGLFGVGMLACAGAMCGLVGRRDRESSVILLLPLAALSLAGAFALLTALAF
jgi:hypothetical protein